MKQLLYSLILLASSAILLPWHLNAQAVWTNADDRNYNGANPPVFTGAFWSFGYVPPGSGGHAGNWSGNLVPGQGGPVDVVLGAPGDTLCNVDVTLNSLTLAPGGALNMDTSSALVVTTTNIEQDGEITEGGYAGGQSGNYTNAGTFEKTAGTGTFTLAPSLVFNSDPGSTISVNSGTLQLAGNGGLLDTVTFVPAAGALIDLVSTATGGSGTVVFQGVLSNGAGAGTVRFSGGTMAGGPRFVDSPKPTTLAFTGNVFQWTGGLMGTYQQGATFINTGVVNMTGDIEKDTYANFTNQSSMIQSGAGTFNVGNYNSGGSFTNAATATYDLQSDANIGQSGYAFNNAGLFKKSGGTGVSTLSVSFNNQGGTVEVDSGTLQLPLNQNSTSTGATFNVAAGAVLDLGDGEHFAGTFTGSGAGTVRLSKGTDPNNLYTDNKTGAVFNFPGSLFQWTGGTLGGYQSGNLVTNMGTINLSGDDDKTSFSVFTNNGTMIQTGAGNFGAGFFNGGTTFTNGAAGVYDLQSDSGINGDYLFANMGLLEKTAGAGASSVNINVANTGTVTVYSGSLTFAKNVDVSNTTLTEGAWNVVDPGTLTFSQYTSGITVNQANVTLSGPGANFPTLNQLADNQGTLSLLASKQFTTAGNFSNEGTLVIDAGSTLHVNGNFTAAETPATSVAGRGPRTKDFTAAGSVLHVVVGGTDSQGASSAGLIQVQGAATLAGRLEIALSATLASLNSTASVTVLSAQSVSGSFANVANGARVDTSDGKGSFGVSVDPVTHRVVLSDFAAPGAAVTPSVTFEVPGSADGKNISVAEGGQKAKILVSRAGSDLTQPLTVQYKAVGSAVPGVNYAPLSGSVTIPAGSASAKIKVKPFDDGKADGSKVIKLKLIGSSAYTSGAITKVKITILDAE